MATPILLRHPASGLVKTGYYGFSWTSLFFGGIPALFRGDILIGILAIAVDVILFPSFGIANTVAHFVWGWVYNKYYTTRLLEQGYVFADTEENIREASEALDVR